jgi:hypothetical protein
MEEFFRIAMTVLGSKTEDIEPRKRGRFKCEFFGGRFFHRP